MPVAVAVGVGVGVGVVGVGVAVALARARRLRLRLAAPALVHAQQQRVVHQVQLGQELGIHQSKENVLYLFVDTFFYLYKFQCYVEEA